MTAKKVSRYALGLLATAALSGCSGGILDPKGQVGVDEKNLILIATGLMLLVVIPVIFLTLYFAWKYRASNKATEAEYAPEWSHSTKIEAVVWIIPCIIILILGTITWISTHELDPYKPLDHEKDHLEVQVVSLNWKWLFIYPEYNIASVNELVFPAHTPLAFTLTSDSTMNSFFIPQLGSQIYTMAAMKTKLHLIADEPGTFMGFSSNYSGAGFTGMKFDAIALEDDAAFEQWIEQVKQSPNVLSGAEYEALTEASEYHPVTLYSAVKPGLFDDVVMKFMKHHGATPFYHSAEDGHMSHMSHGAEHTDGHGDKHATDSHNNHDVSGE
ncbi:ubiquinol oxidase subunit II [Oceanobacter kriegii]|uniref:ubiquinol oxidase subunit II n=1 Tax=Oceanobacter kriegii TaxID=64972 RepID=UPI0006859711|nr:ubiquinol oxidase subunit II [Oceanobacter kriegii]